MLIKLINGKLIVENMKINIILIKNEISRSYNKE